MASNKTTITTKKSAGAFAGLNSKKIAKAWGQPDRELAKAVEKYVTAVDERFLRDKKEEQPNKENPTNSSTKTKHYKINADIRVPLTELHKPNASARNVSRSWPRCEGAKQIVGPDWRGGKMTSNQLMSWGATLLDFWWFNRLPGAPFSRVASSSEIYNTLRHMGEYNPNDENFIWAECEASPALVEPVNIGENIKSFEKAVILEGIGKSVAEGQKPRIKQKDEDDQPLPLAGNNGVYNPSPDSPFHPAKYAGRWPLVPFSAAAHVPLLQHRIPLDELPEILIVHDPWNLLKATGRYEGYGYKDTKEPWTDMPDIIRRYKLQRDTTAKENQEKKDSNVASEGRTAGHGQNAADDHSSESGDRVSPSLTLSSLTPLPSKEEDDDEEEDEAEYRFVVRGDLFNFYSEDYGKPVLVKCPPKPARKTPSEAHLYISPKHSLGKGNHSFVYKAELELPRSMLVEPELCDTCLEEVVQEYSNEHGEEMDRDFNTMIYSEKPRENVSQNMRKKPEKNQKVDKVKQPEQASVSNEDNQGQATGQNALRYARQLAADICMYGRVDPGLVVHPYTPQEYEAVVEAERQGKEVPESTYTYEVRTPRTERIVEYDGMVHELDLTQHPKVQWQSPDLTGPEYCKHLHERLGKDNRVPQTAIVSITAKLSIQYDKHLAREAKNYTNFPEHLFEDWTGYNFIDHTMGPVPVHAVVPQFYGYYLPEGETKKKVDYYLSPILLLENCGEQINPHKLSLDEKFECVSLLQRFHIAGWQHGSVATRNIVRRQGLPSESARDVLVTGGTPSFRLIDFGRSYERGNEKAKLEANPSESTRYDEEMAMKTLLGYDSRFMSWSED